MDLIEIFRLRATMRTLQAQGEALMLSELAPPPIADEDNAAFLLNEAFGERVAVERRLAVQHGRRVRAGQTMELRPLREPFDEAIPIPLGASSSKASAADVYLERRADLQAVLREHTRTFVLADAALERADCRFDLAYDDAADMELPHLSGLRGLARLYTLRAVDRAAAGDAEGALRDCRAIVRLAQMLKEEPILVSHLVRIAIDGIGIGAAESVVTLTTSQPSAIETLAEELARESESLDYALVLRGERAVLFAKMGRYGDRIRGIAILAPWLPRVWQRTCLTFMTDCLEATELPYAQGRDRIDVLTARIQPTGNSILHVRQQLRRGPPAHVLPAVGKAWDSHVRAIAILRAAAIRFQIEANLIRGGIPPDTLDSFDRQLRTDPFTGADFRLRQGDGELLIYSVGQNGRDDHGTYERFNADRSAAVKDDYAMRVPLPDRARQ